MNIGEVSAGSGVPAKMIRYYERIGLIPAPHRTNNGYRSYGEGEVATLRFIRQSRDLGFPLAAIRELLALWQDRARSSRDVKQIALATIDDLRIKRDELQRMIATLEHLAAYCHGDERPNCPILDDLSRPRRVSQDHAIKTNAPQYVKKGIGLLYRTVAEREADQKR